MKHVVSFSGGRTSAYLVHIIEQIKHKNKWDVDYIFIDTGAEDPRTYDFEKEDILDFWDDMPFNLDLDSDIEGNCLFCIKRGVNKIAVGVKRNPKQADRFINLLEEPTVRQIDDRKASTLAMYRGEMSLTDIRKMYSHIEESEINEFIKRSGSVKSGSCSESCEALVCDTEYNDDGVVI